MQDVTRNWLWLALGIAVLLVGSIVALVGTGTPVGEAIELAAAGGDRKLRQPMRPARGRTRVLIFALDGVGYEELRAAIGGGGTPAIASLVGPQTPGDPGLYRHGYAVPGALSVLPSTTYAAWAAVFTGRPAAENGVPGNEWFVREEMRFFAPAPVSVSGIEDAIKVYTEGLIGAALRVPTVYEKVGLRSYVSLASVYRGADLLVIPDLTAFGDLVAAAAEGLTREDKISQEAYEELDRTSVASLITSFREHGLPDLQIVYFPGIDLYTHLASPPLPEQREYLRRVTDPSVRRVLDYYRERGVLDQTYVLFVSDHGHTPVLGDDRHALGSEGPDEPPALIEGAGFRMRPFVLEPEEDERDYQATVAYQGAIAYVYLADRSTCPRPGDVCDWSRPPRFEADVLPVVRAFHANNQTGALIPELEGVLDLIFTREPRSSDQEALPFQIWDGSRLVPIADYLAEHPRPDLLDLEERIEGLSAGPYGHRSGDILLLAHSAVQRPIEERFYFAERYRSWHGSASPQDSRISFLVAHPVRTGEELQALVEELIGSEPSQLDIAPLTAGLLAGEAE